jgi:AbrB family looped-hinge helix DNA binding protein
MAIYRTLYYGDVAVGVGGRITVPQEMREDLGIAEGATLTVRVEETHTGSRQMVLWRTEQLPEE